MLDGIKEKMAQLIDDIEKEVGKESKLYVHAYDIYADLLLISNEVMTREEYAKKKGFERWGSMQEQNYADYLFWLKKEK